MPKPSSMAKGIFFKAEVRQMISLRTKVLVHGNSVFLQFPGGGGSEFTPSHRMAQVAGHPWTDLTGERQGPGVVFRGNGGDQNFFHVAIPSPNVVPVFTPAVITPESPEEGPPHNY